MAIDANTEYRRIQAGLNQFSGLGSETRQKQEYMADKWGELSGLCARLLEDARFAKQAHSVGDHCDRMHGEAFEAGISGRCEDCEQDKELQAENAKLREENKALEEIRRIAESYVSAPPQVRGGVFRNLDKKLLALSGKRN